MRPFTAIGVWKRRTKLICSAAPPPANSTAPVSPWNASNRLLASAPMLHTTGSARPSVVVTMGEPLPRLFAHQATVMVGGAVAPRLSATRLPGVPGQPTPLPLVVKTTEGPAAAV